MKKIKQIFIASSENSKEMSLVMRKVRMQVKKYRTAKRKGTLKKMTVSQSEKLFNV
ncbi:MAG: hypothetical protein J0L69_13085 [Bacteroidetes bacterium]|nr:hypothetical protein [Bacteroidota bacterium]